MDRTDMEYLARLIADAVRDALSGVSVNVDGAALGYLAADAINRNRASDGRPALEL